MPGRLVCTRPTVRGLSAATRMSGVSARAASRQRSRTPPGTANGMILTVAAIWRGSIKPYGVSVATVTASSTRLTASRRARSRTSTPRVSAIRLTRPVNAALALKPSPMIAPASLAAALSSCTSPTSRRAAITCATPALPSAATSSTVSTRPFLKVFAPSLSEWARIAPSASPTGISPKIIPRPRT